MLPAFVHPRVLHPLLVFIAPLLLAALSPPLILRVPAGTPFFLHPCPVFGSSRRHSFSTPLLAGSSMMAIRDLLPDAVLQAFPAASSPHIRGARRFLHCWIKYWKCNECTFVGENCGKPFTLPAIASAFTAELYALFQCMHHVLCSRTRCRVVFSDLLSNLPISTEWLKRTDIFI